MIVKEIQAEVKLQLIEGRIQKRTLSLKITRNTRKKPKSLIYATFTINGFDNQEETLFLRKRLAKF